MASSESQAQANLDFRQQITDKLNQLSARLEEDYTRALQIENACNILLGSAIPGGAATQAASARNALSQAKQFVARAVSIIESPTSSGVQDGSSS